MGIVYQINVKPETPGERGLPKQPVSSARVTFQGIKGDFNRYRYQQKEDDPADRALLLLPLEVITDLNSEDWPVKPGDLGENITTKDMPYNEFMRGQAYFLGEVEIRIHDQAHPCGNLKRLPYITQENYQRFKQILEGRRGWYARVLTEGTLKQNDLIQVSLLNFLHDFGTGNQPITRKDIYDL